MTKVLILHPGPDFSVADVFTGWSTALTRLGCDVREYNLNDRLAFYAAAEIEGKRLSKEETVHLAGNGILSKCYQFEPDIVLAVSGFYITPFIWNLWREKKQKVVLLFTESPYEDDWQAHLVKEYEPTLTLINDPTNLELFDGYPVAYLPHAYDPTRHMPGTGAPERDFVFVGTGYPSRREFFDQVDWTDIDGAFAGNWRDLPPESPINRMLIHEPLHCSDNDETVSLYQSSKASANLYRASRRADLEANKPELAAGWSVGPREIELAACETFFLREPRGEGEELFPMLPTFTEPGEFSETLRWWLDHDAQREAAAAAARSAISNRTFDAHAARMLQIINQ